MNRVGMHFKKTTTETTESPLHANGITTSEGVATFTLCCLRVLHL